jgi:hypothetical protein
METTIGQRVLAAVISHQLGIPTDRALKLYVQGLDIHLSWEQVGETLLRSSAAFTVAQAPRDSGLQIVRRNFGSERAQ